MSLSKKRIVFLLALLLAGSLFAVAYLAVTGNGVQKFTDVVIEYTAIFASNKSAERNLVFFLTFTGIVAYGVYYFCSCKNQEGEVLETEVESIECGNLWICIFGVMAGISYFVFANINAVLMGSLIVMFFILLIDKTLVLLGVVFYYMSIYAVYGLYRMYVFAGGENSFTSIEAAFLVAVVMFGILVLSKDKQRMLLRGCLAGQMLVPAVLLVYLASKYKYQDEIVVIPVPMQVKVLIFVLLVLFLAEDLRVLKKGWKTALDLKNVISFGTCVCIMAFNRFGGTGAVISSDTHHPFENIIGYSQIFELGQKPFSEYIPVSGMYSVIQGAIFRFFGNGQAGNYYIAENIFYLLAVILVVALLWMQVSRIWGFLISLLFYMMDYNRIVFILPVMLLLVMPKLIAKKNMWFLAWFLTSLFHGLYYPLFGVAVCVAFLPLGIWQMITYVKSGKLRKDTKKTGFWVSCGVCIVLTVACAPCLAGTYRHMKAMAGQTIYADGIARFGQIVPEWFFPYLNQFPVIRIALYDIFSFLIPAGFVWIMFALFLDIAGAGIWKRRLYMVHPQAAFVAASLVIMPTICFSSTVVRSDVGSLYARSAGPLFAGMVILLVMLERYVKIEKIRYFVICTAVFIPTVVNSTGFFMADSKLDAYEIVPDGYTYIQKDNVEKLGTGFLAQEVYDTVSSANQVFAEEDRAQSYFGKRGNFGFFYLNDVKGDATMEIAGTVRGFEATQEAIDIVRNNKTVIGNDLNPFYNYYLYHWLLTSGEYIWSEEKECFLPNDENIDVDKVRNMHQEVSLSWEGIDIGKCAGALGLSKDSLDQIFTEKNTELTLQQGNNGIQILFSNTIDGDEADYLYLEFTGMDQDYHHTLYHLSEEQEQDGGILAKNLMKKNYNPGMMVCVSWLDVNGEGHAMYCAMSQGKLMIPLGAGVKWLLHPHTQIQISVMQDGQEISVPQISDIQFLKLREAG
ncbi:MAG: hypothetical protein K2N87_16680 [Eubacterium sp.]|nr:hypothetical protein [Eubacterium sp.]